MNFRRSLPFLPGLLAITVLAITFIGGGDIAGAGSLVFGMAAATAALDTQKRVPIVVDLLPVLDDAVIYAGTIVAITSAGYARPAADVAGLIVRGVALETVDNTNGGNGGAFIQVGRGEFLFANDATLTLGIAHVGKLAHVVDNQTVGDDGGTNDILAGEFMGFEDGDSAGKCWIKIPRASATAAS